MSEIGLNVDVGQIATSAMDGLTTVILWVLVVALIGVVAYLAFYLMSFKHKVRVRRIIKGRTYIIDDRAKEFKIDGAIWWKLLKTKIKTTAPPEEAIDITKKGKLVVEAYLTKDDQLIWRTDRQTTEGFTETLKSADGDYRVFSSEERALYINELREAETYKKKKISDLLVAAAPYIAIILIFVCFLIFFNEVVAPAKELGASIRASHDLQLETMKIMRDIIQNKETMLLNNVSIPN